MQWFSSSKNKWKRKSCHHNNPRNRVWHFYWHYIALTFFKGNIFVLLLLFILSCFLFFLFCIFLQINFPSALISSLDVALSDGHLLSTHKSPEDFGSRKFPEVWMTSWLVVLRSFQPGMYLIYLPYGYESYDWFIDRIVKHIYIYIFIQGVVYIYEWSAIY